MSNTQLKEATKGTTMNPFAAMRTFMGATLR